MIRKSRDKQTQLDTYVWDSGATKYELQMENGIQGQPNTADGEWDTGATKYCRWGIGYRGNQILQMENGIQGQPNTADGEWDTGA